MDGNESPAQSNYDNNPQPGAGAAGAPEAPETAAKPEMPEETVAPEPQKAPEPNPSVEQIAPEEAGSAQAQAPEPSPNNGGKMTSQSKEPSGPKVKMNIKINVPHLRLILSAIAIIIVFGAVLFLVKMPTSSTTSTVTTSIMQINMTNLSGCEVISAPGTYSVTSDFNTSITSGACILITADNVQLVGNQHKITGSGPYVGTPPYTYGVELVGVSNVSVTGLGLSRFSYGVFLNGTELSTISGDNITQSTLSGIYLVMSGNNTIENDQVSHSLSSQGGVHIESGGKNVVRNSSIINNVYYGLVVNSTNNSFYGDVFASNPTDLLCNATSAFRYSNTFSGSTCSINDFCEFATCKSNVPFNLSSLRLSQGNVSSCGSIFAPGSYVLTKNLSTSNYLNASNPLTADVSCIKVFAPDVTIDCAGNAIDYSGYGIYLNSTFNTSISNCAFNNDNYGIYANSAPDPHISNTTAGSDVYGVYFYNITGGKIDSIKMSNNTYGIFLNSSFGVVLSQLDAQKNTFGVYSGSGGSNIFNGGYVFNNTKADVYCSPNEFNSSTDLMQNVQCGITDCLWATCNQKTPPMEKAYPVSACMNITYSGLYSVVQNVLAQGTCFNVRANNVTLDCGSHLLSGSATGSAIYMNNETNVTLSNCKITGFNTGVNVSNTKFLDMRDMILNGTTIGTYLSKVSLSDINAVNSSGYSSYGFFFDRVNDTNVMDDIASQGFAGATGFLFTNSTKNIVAFDNATENPTYGFVFTNSKNNNIFNNSAFSNTGSDYMCAGSSTGLYSEPLGINFGLSKDGCGWLVAVSPLVLGPQCAAVSTPEQMSFGSDLVYKEGATCFSVYLTANSSANGTTINCNRHIMYATHGGTFLNVVNASTVHLENCILINFTDAVSSGGLYTGIFNNTIVEGQQAIVLNNTRFASIRGNKIQNITNGISIADSNADSVFNNSMYNAAIGMNFSGSTNLDIEQNYLTNGVSGLTLRDSTQSTLKGNSFLNMVDTGIACYGTSSGQSSASLDLGGNSCSNNRNCTWVTSPSCMP